MKKIIRLFHIIDEKTIDQLVMLDRLVHLYADFMETWRDVELTSDGTNVRVKWLRINKYGHEAFTEREFPMTDIQKRISIYKRKIKTEYYNRHNNVRVQREKETRKWQKHIEDARV